MPLPMIKLASLFVKQFSKRLSNAVKERAKHSAFFRKLCIKPAQFYHGFELDFHLTRMGFGKATKKQPLNPERAVELGAEMIGEAFLYGFLVTILFVEYTWSNSTAEKKKQAEKDNMDSIVSRLDEQSFAVATLEAEIRQLQRTVGELESSNFALTNVIEKLKLTEKDKKNGGWLRQ